MENEDEWSLRDYSCVVKRVCRSWYRIVCGGVTVQQLFNDNVHVALHKIALKIPIEGHPLTSFLPANVDVDFIRSSYVRALDSALKEENSDSQKTCKRKKELRDSLVVGDTRDPVHEENVGAESQDDVYAVVRDYLSPPSKSNFDLSRFHALKDRYTSAGIQIPRNFPDEAVKYYYLSLKDRVKRLFKKVRSWVEAQNADSMRYILLNQDMSASLKSWLLTQHTFTPITIPCNVRDPRGTLRKYALCYNDSRVILGRETAPPPAALTPFYDYEQLLTLLPNLDPVFALPKILEYGKTVVDLGSYRVVEK